MKSRLLRIVGAAAVNADTETHADAGANADAKPAAASAAGSAPALAPAGRAEMKSPRRRLIRRLGALALLPLFGLVFWTAATIASSLPGLIVVAVNVHGIGLASYAGDSPQRPAPLSIQVLQDVQGDASGSRTSAPTPVPAPSPTPTPSPTPGLPLPTPTPLPSPLPSPTPAPGAATITGQVQDSQTHLPIAAATISLSPGGASVLTDANGNFSVSVDPGSYTVAASAATYNSASQTVSVNSGQKTTLSFKLVSITAYGSLAGSVSDSATKAPVVGATVTLSDGLIRVTDGSGNFAYSIVLNGTYTLTVSALGYATQSQVVTIRAGHTTNVQIALVHA
jgi:Carboxypeptidase regulatory-like domain/CarboxypepD_reg-like domain